MRDRMQLFDGGGDSDSDSGDKEEPPSLEINEEYACRYEHNKNREDLHRLEELKKRGLVDDDEAEGGSESSSEDDDDVDEIVRKESSKQKELELLEAIIKVRNRDPILKNKDVELFKSDKKDETEKIKEEEEEEKDENGATVNNQYKEEKKEKKKKKEKKVYLKDVIATHLLEGGAEFSESNNNDGGKKSYGEEQEQLKREFLEAVNEDEDEEEEDLLKLKDGNAVEEEDEDEEFNKKLEECFPDEDEKDRFLKEYIKNRMWLDKAGQGRGGGSEIREEDLEMVSEDEMEIEKQEEYEYRFQENAGDRVLGHAREVEGSVRKKVKARKEQRKNKEERMEIAKLEREEELRHMKNLKKKENEEKVKKIMKIAGIKEGEESLFNTKELEGEFDPQEYDRMMKKAFDEGYYEDEDEEFGSDMDEDDDGDVEKPDFDKEDELLGLPKGWDGAGSGDGFLAAREKVLKLKETKTGSDSEEEEDEKEDTDDEDEDEDEDEDDDEEGEDEEEDKMSEESKKEKKRKLAILERAKKEMLDEYYKLDYEDTIGDLKTRFRYAKIKPNRFGLTTAEVLMMDEKELNQYVSLKKLAPYTEKEWKVPNSKRNEIKKRAREIFRHGKVDDKKRSTKKFKVKDDRKDSDASTSATTKHGKEQVQDSSGETTIKLSRSARRKQNKKAAALPPSRLKAYGVE